jgi:3,4-dihydroxy 2-butanone 4-phosphate synthase/GTP cyclohydrolase II
LILASTILETAHGTFTVSTHGDGGPERCLAIYRGDLSIPGTTVRFHSSCIFGETLLAYDCDCGQQLATALREIGTRRSGIVVYLYQEGRGAGLDMKIRGMECQRVQGVNSYEAYASLGLPRDLRDYSLAGTALADLKVAKTVTLLSNNPAKREALEGLGYVIDSQVAMSYQVSKRAYEYLLMKQVEGKHSLDFSRINFVG